MPLRLVPTLFAFLAAVGRANKSAYNNSVLDPSHIENQVWAQVFNPHYGLHVFALGKNQSLFHKFQIGNASKITDSVPFSRWHCLTPNASLTFDTDPAAAVNANGQIEVFARMSEFIDLWQIYQQDPKDPLSFSKAREGTCMCPAVSPEDCPWCISCVADPDCDKQYFSNHAPFPTSAASVLMRPDRRLQVNFRGFDGQMYGLIQNRSGDPTKYVQGPVYAAVFE